MKKQLGLFERPAPPIKRGAWEGLFFITVDGSAAGSERGITNAMTHGRALHDSKGSGILRIREESTGDTWEWVPGTGFRKGKSK
jgi:hypothetical protein